MNDQITFPVDDDPILRLPEVKRETGLGRTTIYRYMKERKFPQPHKIGDQAVGWPRSAIREWKATRAPKAVPA